jgi:tetratricopeptide (TPR) repeat protein
MRLFLGLVAAMCVMACEAAEPPVDLRLCGSRAGQASERLRACDEMLPLYEEGSRGYGAVLTWRAQAKESNDDVAGAQRDYEEALNIDPDNPSALLGLGGILLDAGDLTGAQRYLHRSIEVHESGRAADMLGGYALRHDENRAAFDYYDDLLDRVPDHEIALYGRGVARLRLGDEGGRVDIEKARAGYPNVDREFAERGIAAP